MKTIIALSIACTTMLLSLGAARAQSPNPPGIKLDHYQCYRVSPETRFRQRKVKLKDQFGGAVAGILRESFLCAPVEKNDGKIANKQDHLMCYVVSGGKDARKRVLIINQFGRAIVKVGGTITVCVPSLKKVL
jgi:hypothetical protein